MKRHFKLLTIASALALVALGMSATGSVLAQDAKAMSGGLCVPLLPATSTYNPWTQTKIYAVNAHTADLSYTCPAITRDNETSTTGLAAAAVSVRVQPGKTLNCTIRSASQFNVQLDIVVGATPTRLQASSTSTSPSAVASTCRPTTRLTG